ncbi:toprim domain-containing protein [Salmonella enterica]|nr:toprim domain-containing protein [Salmonella enterica]
MNVLELLDLKGIEYKDTGGDILIRCLNPEHNDAHPSLRVDRETGVFHCLSCGYGKGIPSIFHYFNEDMLRQSPRLVTVKKRIKELLNQSNVLTIPDAAMMFEEEYRGIKPETFKKYFAFIHEEDWPDRIVFPITDATGKIVVFQGRSRQSSAPPKYLLKPKDISAPIFPLRYNQPILVLTEGMFDMLNLEDKGMENVSCCFGTHQFSNDNIADKFSSFILAGTRIVAILLDNDKAGNDAAEKLAKMIKFKTRLTPLVVNHLLPDNKDPGELSEDEVKELDENIKKIVAKYLKNEV